MRKQNPKIRSKKSSSTTVCPQCASSMKEAQGILEFLIHGENIRVPEMTFLKCQKCDEKILRLDEAKKLRERAIESYRKKYHLMTSEEIIALRQRNNLTQSELASLLKLGVNTLSRWESGRNVQNSAMDVLLKLIRDVPGTLVYLQNLAA